MRTKGMKRGMMGMKQRMQRNEEEDEKKNRMTLFKDF